VTTTSPALGQPAVLRGPRHTRTWIFTTMLVSGVLALLASIVLSVDAVLLAAAPQATLACDINAVVSCGAVAQSWQAHVFGFPNAFIGMATEPVIITIAVASLAGTRFPRWFMLAAQIGYLLGLIFAWWLFSQTLFVIGSVCPWCLLITVTTTITFLTFLHWNVLENNLYLPIRAHARGIVGIRMGLDVLALVIALGTIAGLLLAVHGVRLFA
jgi:uncharacterized membrane protein